MRDHLKTSTRADCQNASYVCTPSDLFFLSLYDKEHTICTVTATNDPSFETVCAWNFFIFKYSILLWKSPKHIWMQNFYQIRQKPKIAVFCYVTSHNPFATTDLRLCFRQIPGSFPAFFQPISIPNFGPWWNTTK